MDTIYELVHYLKGIQYDELPQEVIDSAKMLLTDVIAVSVAGSDAEGVKEAAELMIDWGGKEESTVLVFDKKLPADHAGFLNSVLSHARDFDEVHPGAVVHTGITVIPTVLTVADAIGGVDGKKIIETIVAAVDLDVRLGNAVTVSGTKSGWIYSALLGNFAAAFAAGLLLDLSEEQLVNALGIVYAQAGGNQQAARDTTLTKRMQPGFAVRSGIFSAYLAKKGITGPRNLIDGVFGFYHQYLKDECDKSRLLENQGKVYGVTGLSYKVFPVCGQCLSPVTTVDALMKEHHLTASDITEIEVGSNRHGYTACVEPEEVKYHPSKVVDGQFSIPFAVSTMAVKRHVNLSDLTDEGISDSDVAEMMKKVKAVVDPNVEAEFPRGIARANVTLHTTKGDFTGSVYHKGHPENPVTKEDMAEKLKGCFQVGLYPVREGAEDEILAAIDHLEDLDDISRLIRQINDSFIRS